MSDDIKKLSEEAEERKGQEAEDPPQGQEVSLGLRARLARCLLNGLPTHQIAAVNASLGYETALSREAILKDPVGAELVRPIAGQNAVRYVENPNAHYIYGPDIFLIGTNAQAPDLLAPVIIEDRPPLCDAEEGLHITHIEVFDSSPHVAAIKLGAHYTNDFAGKIPTGLGLHQCQKASAMIIDPETKKTHAFAIADGHANTAEAGLIARFLAKKLMERLAITMNKPGQTINLRKDIPRFIIGALAGAKRLTDRNLIDEILGEDSEGHVDDSVFVNTPQNPLYPQDYIGEHSLLVGCREGDKMHLFMIGDIDFCTFTAGPENVTYRNDDSTKRVSLTRKKPFSERFITHYSTPIEEGRILMAYTRGVLGTARDTALSAHTLAERDESLSLPMLQWTLINQQRIKHSQWNNDLVSISIDL